MNRILEIKGLKKSYKLGKNTVSALRGIDLVISKGQTFAIVGESGCGKSTLGKIAVNLEQPSAGEIYYDGIPIHNISARDMQPLRRRVQIIFQDSSASLNPSMTIEEIVSEGLVIHEQMSKAVRREKVIDILSQVGLPASVLTRKPHEFSGGQRQRINIARALVLDPEFLICDEPLSSLDATTQCQIIDLLKKLKAERQLTFLFISHDLSAVEAIADIAAVMYFGEIVEQAPVDQLFKSPKHPYSKALIAAAPKHGGAFPVLLNGEPPSPLSIPQGCPFHPRCPQASEKCRHEVPRLKEVDTRHIGACHLL